MKQNYLILSILLFVGFVSANAEATFNGSLEQKTMPHNGYTRDYLIYVPIGEHPEGIVITMHGIGQSMTDFVGKFDFRQTADQLNYVLISPQALPEQDSSVIEFINKLSILKQELPSVIPIRALWDCGLRATATIPEAGEGLFALMGIENPLLDVVLNKNIDDVGFLDKLIRQTLEEYDMPNRNIFVSGTSMGGYMSYQYALTHSQDINLSGIIPIVGTHGTEIAGEANEVKVPVCDFSGEQDEEVPYYNGWYEMPVIGEVKVKIEVAKPKPDVIDFWVNKNGAVAEPAVYTYPTSGTKNTTVTKYTYAATDGKNEVIHYKSDNTDHNYFFRKSNGDAMDYFEEITQFILAHASDGTYPETDIPGVPAENRLFYPNPAQNIIQLTTTKGTVSIHDLMGRKVFSETIRSGQVDVSSIKSGVYIISIQSEGKIQTSKFIKQ
jgi:poly(3-hydroxybutyrate) depolymerase